MKANGTGQSRGLPNPLDHFQADWKRPICHREEQSDEANSTGNAQRQTPTGLLRRFAPRNDSFDRVFPVMVTTL
jgi:hypothetical protein